MTKKNQKILHLSIIFGILLISFFAWNTFVLFPIKIFVVLLHEMSHGIVAVFTGGKIISIEVTEYLGGITTTEGGNIILIASSGYLGSIAIGTLLFYSSFDKKLSIWFTTGLAILLLIFTANFLIGTVSQITAMLAAIILIISPRYFNAIANQILLQAIGLVSVFYVLIDMKEDLLSGSTYKTDSNLLESLTTIPSTFIALFWMSISIIVIYFLVRKLLLAK
ncbi:MAG: M50 family metallopeptidase [Melioribacteraceae bacterium]|nr:MAG: M50 family metallopeptidase [Melioribacteraceae bacterium]